MLLPFTLLTILISLAIAFIALRVFTRLLEKVVRRVIPNDDASGWLTFIKVATYVAALPREIHLSNAEILRWPVWWMVEAEPIIFKVYLIMVEALRGVFTALAYFFIVAAVAYVIVLAIKRGSPQGSATQNRA